jgi:hypothetical protein
MAVKFQINDGGDDHDGDDLDHDDDDGSWSSS